MAKPGSAVHFPHRIITTDDTPQVQRSRQKSPEEQMRAQEYADDLLKRGATRPSVSPYSAPVVLVPRIDGTTRVYVDYRKLNAVTKKDVYPLTRVDESLDTLGKAKFLTTFDLT